MAGARVSTAVTVPRDSASNSGSFAPMADRSIPNEGSTARDHLANERTFLAWVRTALGVIGLGVALEKLVDTGLAALGGVALIIYGIVILLYALLRYRRVESALIEGRFLPARRGPILIGALGLVLSVGAMLFVLR